MSDQYSVGRMGFNVVETILLTFGYFQGGFLLSRLIKYLTENFATEEKAQEVQDFFEEHNFPGTDRTVSQSLETIRLSADWLRRDLGSITKYLDSN